MHAKFLFFAAHDDGVEQSEIAEQEERGDPRMGGDGDAQGEDRAAEIERVTRVGVGSCDRENRLFVEVACCQGTNEQADAPDERAIENALRSGVSQHQHDDREGIAQAHAPAREESGSPHEDEPILRRTASKTEST